MLKITSPGGFLTSLTTDDDNLYTEYVQYRWDAFGNLEYRHDQSGSKNLKETFEYDILNRLTAAVTTGDISHNEAFAYDGHGNITSKTGMGSYTYQAGTHRVIATSQYGGNTWSDLTHCNDTSSTNYCYDSTGNMTSDDTGRTLNYTAYDKPYRIESGAGHVTEFLYGPNRARYVRKDTNTEGELQTTFYVGNVEKIVYESGDYTIRRYVAGVGMIVQDFYSNDLPTEAEDLRYFYKDHLGSLSIITNAAGNITAQMSFDAFGKRRHHEQWNKKLTIDGDILAGFNSLELVTQARTNRGYTGHEQLDEVELIHMNGRVYDANLGRFLSADTFVPDANNLQAYNRYSYVMNNPLNATDPSGHIPCELRPILAIVYAVVMSYLTFGVAGVAAMSWQGAAAAAQIGFWSGYIATGTLKGAVRGAVTAAVFSGIGAFGVDQGLWTATSAVTNSTFWISNAIAGGVLADLQGGKFATGFLASGFSAVAGGLSAKIPWATTQVKNLGQVMISSLVGGTVSKISGGKFANGFMTSGLQALLSVGLRNSSPPEAGAAVSDEFVPEAEESIARRNQEFVASVEEINRNNPEGFNTHERAARALSANSVMDLNAEGEYGAIIVKGDDGRWRIVDAAYNGRIEPIARAYNIKRANSRRFVSDSEWRSLNAKEGVGWHTHPTGSKVSNNDATSAADAELIGIYASSNSGDRLSYITSGVINDRLVFEALSRNMRKRTYPIDGY